jgi:anti-sigma factor RsiW
MRCGEADAFTHAYVDGELAGRDRESYEQHLLGCEACSGACRLQARFKAAVRGHLPRLAVPIALRMRLERAITSSPPIRRRWLWDAYPRLAPAAAAAVILVTILAASRTTSRRTSPLVVEQALRAYHTAMPMDVVDSNCSSLVNWFRDKVDFAVPPPPRHLGTCQGGRLVNVQDRFGAYFLYQDARGHRLTVMVFDGGDEDLDGPRRRVVSGRDVYLERGRGATTAAFRDRDGLYYVVTTDVDEDALLSLIAASLSDRR